MGKNEGWGRGRKWGWEKVKNRGTGKKFQKFDPKNAYKHTKEPLFVKIDLLRC